MRIVRQIPDLANAMKGTQVSVSHAGYNTVADILRAGCACVLYPYAEGKETEQLRRSEIMAEHGLATTAATWWNFLPKIWPVQLIRQAPGNLLK